MLTSSLLFLTALSAPSALPALDPIGTVVAGLRTTADPQEIAIPGTATRVRVFVADGRRQAAVSRDGGRSWRALPDVRTELALRYATFDPRVSGEPAIAPELRAEPAARLFLVQFETEVIEEYKDALARLGAVRRHAMPHQAYVVRMAPGVAKDVAALPFVRWVGAYHPAYRIDPALLDALTVGGLRDARDYNVMMVDDVRDRGAVLARIAALGGEAQPDSGSGVLQVARLDAKQLVALAQDDTVLWIDALTEAGVDIQNARIQSGANAIETLGGFAGKGVTGMIMEGIYGDPNQGIAVHPEFDAIAPYRTTPIAFPNATAAAPSSHGNSTAGEIYARGGLNAAVRGMLPFAQPLYCNYNYVYGNNNRKSVTQWGLSNHEMIETASWGYGTTTTYDSRSAEMDDIIFDLDVLTTQSQSNTNSLLSRPQAWAKNIVSIGGFMHQNTATPADDTASGASFGPAADGRQKPELCAYYDSIDTTAGAASGYTASFNGTSGATPMVNGMAGLMVEMFASGVFGHGAPTSWQTLHLNKPHFTTAKSLLFATSYLYAPTKFGTAAQTRNRQGWGFPDLAAAYGQRERMLVSDEEFALQQGQTRSWFVFVPPATPELRVSMTYADPEANPAAAVTRQNSVDLRVQTPAGVTYWGNNGMTVTSTPSPANTSAAGGVANDVDTSENVFLQAPAAGLYVVSVDAATVRVDGHVETGVDDVDFGVVINGIGGSRNHESVLLDLDSPAPGTFTVTATNVPAGGWVEGFTLFSATTGLIAGNGNLFGVELDGLVTASLAQPVGSVFHFAAGQPGFPNAPYAFPAPIAALLQGVTFDAVVVLFANGGGIAAVSNVDRVQIQ